ncbi:hypothetical protein [uncultured Variovorax sp.]|uniref:hypothetical protein n=1 Tax=uncultured Variovorax sp. TaxID=114708 RepID=UPI0025CD6840|nr:hypothetical protein [uncultured Variovorax sp.]
MNRQARREAQAAAPSRAGALLRARSPTAPPPRGVALDVVNEVSFLSTAIWMTAAGTSASIVPSAFACTQAGAFCWSSRC